MAPVEDEWNDDLAMDFFVRTWFIHHLGHQKCERPRIIELGREWQRWHAEILQGWTDFIGPQQEHSVHVVKQTHPDQQSIKELLRI